MFYSVSRPWLGSREFPTWRPWTPEECSAAVAPLIQYLTAAPIVSMRLDNSAGQTFYLEDSRIWDHLCVAPPGVALGLGASFLQSMRQLPIEGMQMLPEEQATMFGVLCLLYEPVLRRRLEQAIASNVLTNEIVCPYGILDSAQIQIVAELGRFMRDGCSIRVTRVS